MLTSSGFKVGIRNEYNRNENMHMQKFQFFFILKFYFGLRCFLAVLAHALCHKHPFGILVVLLVYSLRSRKGGDTFQQKRRDSLKRVIKL